MNKLYVSLLALITAISVKAQTQLEIRPEIGKKYLVQTTVNFKETREATKDREGKTAHGKLDLTLHITAERINDKGNYELACQVKKVVFSFYNRRNDTTMYDSDAPETAYSTKSINRKIDDDVDGLVTFLGSNVVLLEMSRQGQFLQMVNIKELLAKAASERAARTGEPIDENDEMRAWITEDFSKMLFFAMNQLTDFYDGKFVQAGDVWEENRIDSLKRLIVNGNQTLSVTSQSQNTVTIAGNRTISFNQDNQEDFEILKNFEVKLNTTTGIIEQGTYTFSYTEPLTETDIAEGKKPEIATMEINIAIAPAP